MQRITDYLAAQAKGQGQQATDAAAQPTQHDQQASPPAADPLPLSASRFPTQTAFTRPLVPQNRRGDSVRNCRAGASDLSIKPLGGKNPAGPRGVAANGGQSGCKTVGERAQARADRPSYHADPAARACASRPRSCAHGREATVHGSSGLRTADSEHARQLFRAAFARRRAAFRDFVEVGPKTYRQHRLDTDTRDLPLTLYLAVNRAFSPSCDWLSYSFRTRLALRKQGIEVRL